MHAFEKNALNLADMRYGLSAEEMEVGEIFVTKGKVVKRIRIMGRGRAGIARCVYSPKYPHEVRLSSS